MEDVIDISTINLNENLNDNWDTSGFGSGSGSGSKSSGSNFGSGIELLMNDKKKENSSKNIDIELDDLSNLEDELNNLTNDDANTRYESKSDLFNGNFNFEDKHSVHFDDKPNISIGQSTAEADTDHKTWDGFSKFNNI